MSRTGLILLGLCLWLILLALQALSSPFDGYVPAHTTAPGASISSGPILAGLLLPLARSLLTPKTAWLSYSLLLVATPLYSAWLVTRVARRTMPSGTGVNPWAVLSIVLLLALLTVLNLPYLSNDIFLYRLHGQMISRLGCSPYATTPSDCFPSEAVTNVPWVDQKSPYGPLALLLFAGMDAPSNGVVFNFWALKIVLSLPWLVMMVYAYSSGLFQKNKKLGWLAWIGLNPLLALEVGQNGHLDGWVGLLLVIAVVGLLRVSNARAIFAGAVFGLACAIKLSVVAAAPAIWMWTASSAETTPRARRGTILPLTLCILSTLVVLATLYWPFWQGTSTFAGVREESDKTLRSLYSVLGFYLHLSPRWIIRSSFLGNLIAAVGGMLFCRRRKNLAEGLVVCLLAQAILGRTFLQPWYFCAPVMLAPLVGVVARRTDGAVWTSERVDATMVSILRFTLVSSASVIAGGYAVLFLAKGLSPEAQSLSFLCMVAPPFIAIAIGPRINHARPRTSSPYTTPSDSRSSSQAP